MNEEAYVTALQNNLLLPVHPQYFNKHKREVDTPSRDFVIEEVNPDTRADTYLITNNVRENPETRIILLSPQKSIYEEIDDEDVTCNIP